MSTSSVDDPIKKLLESTGWSCEDLLKKLQSYKTDKTIDVSYEYSNEERIKTISKDEDCNNANDNVQINKPKVCDKEIWEYSVESPVVHHRSPSNLLNNNENENSSSTESSDIINKDFITTLHPVSNEDIAVASLPSRINVQYSQFQEITDIQPDPGRKCDLDTSNTSAIDNCKIESESRIDRIPIENSTSPISDNIAQTEENEIIYETELSNTPPDSGCSSPSSSVSEVSEYSLKTLSANVNNLLCANLLQNGKERSSDENVDDSVAQLNYISKTDLRIEKTIEEIDSENNEIEHNSSDPQFFSVVEVTEIGNNSEDASQKIIPNLTEVESSEDVSAKPTDTIDPFEKTASADYAEPLPELDNTKMCHSEKEIETLAKHSPPAKDNFKHPNVLGRFDVRKKKFCYMTSKISNKAVKSRYRLQRNMKQCINNDHNRSEKYFTEEVEDPNVDTEEQEDIRKNLLLQLSTLRSRKKTINLFDEECKKIASFGDIKMNYKKQLIDTAEPADNSPSVSKGKEALFSMSNETEFRILNVTGGVDVVEEEQTEMIHEDDTIKLTKTKDITKIKGWKNKRFTLGNNTTDDQSKTDVVENLRKIIHHKEKCCESNENSSLESCTNDFKIDEETSSSCEDKSPFISDSLDEFLSENSTLNISYNIPKSGAEEGLASPTKSCSRKALTSPTHDKVALSRAVSPPIVEVKVKQIKPKTLAEKRKLLEGYIVKRDKTIKKNFTKINSEEFSNMGMKKRSYVMYNDEKLWLPSTNENECIANIQYDEVKQEIKTEECNTSNYFKKPSLLGDLKCKDSQNVRYKPGPMSKKWKLQSNVSTSKWNSFVKKLPQVSLEVMPQIGKPIPPQVIHLLPKFESTIQGERLEYALGAVHCKYNDTSRKIFRFPVPYQHNQKSVLVRKRRIVHDYVSVLKTPIAPEKNSVSSVLSDIITYVETKEIEDTLFKEDDSHIAFATGEIQSPKKIDDNVSVMRKLKKRTRVDLELHRLSCKVVNVTMDTSDFNIDCSKPYCRLGCVCQSIACEDIISLHCYKPKCMFNCSCRNDRTQNYDEDIILPGGIDILSTDTVNRIEGQAKRHLAKIEKEFTQTIIHTQDKTIVVGSGGRNKLRRITKTPKKYMDYIENIDSLKVVIEPEDNKTIIANTTTEFDFNEGDIAKCFVKLEKLELKTVVPLCLYHNCYNCPCILDCKTEYYTDYEEAYPEVSPPPNKARPVQENCARVRGVFSQFLIRNMEPLYISKLRQRVKTYDLSGYLIPTNMAKPYSENNSSEIDVETILPISAADRLKLFLSKKHIARVHKMHKRKQELEIKYDQDVAAREMSIQRRKKHKKYHENSSPNDGEVTTNSNNLNFANTQDYVSVFDGEIVVPTNENIDFVKKLGVKNVSEYMRLLPWVDLMNNYYAGKIKIWSSNQQSSRLLMNTSDKLPPSDYVDIDKAKVTTGIISWILNKKLPNKTPVDLVHLILSPNEEHFEITGICLKNIIKPAKKQEIKMSDVEVEHTDPNFLRHKNVENVMNVLCMTEHCCSPRQLALAAYCKGECNETFPITVELPKIRKSSRWRMLLLNSNFSFLSFINNKYTIKYTDLMHIVKRARHSNMTICLDSKQLCEGYTQKNYGIYAVPKYQDRLFVGPYTDTEPHALETLRYLRQSLISTKVFEEINNRGSNITQKAVWLVESAQRKSRRVPDTQIPEKSSSLPALLNESKCQISLLKNSYTKPQVEKITLKDILDQPSQQKCNDNSWKNQVINDNHKIMESYSLSSNESEQSCIKFPQFVLLNGKKMTMEDYNRFIITNIPHFGYLGAIQSESSKVIDVSWPFESKVLRFPNTSAATEFLKRRFSNLLLPVPTTFKVQLIILTELDFNSYQPVEVKFLGGTYICGDFGVIDSRTLTSKMAESIGTTQEEVLERLAKRAQFLGASEISKLEELEKGYVKTKRELIIRKQTNLAKYMQLIMQLPEKEKLKEYSKFRKQFNDRNITPPIGMKKIKAAPEVDNSECILIEDSDDEDHPEQKPDISELQKKEGIMPPPPTVKSRKLSPRSLLKPNLLQKPNKIIISSQNYNKSLVSNITNTNAPKTLIKGFKFVKLSSGRLVLMRDRSQSINAIPIPATKMRIRNNIVIRRENFSNNIARPDDIVSITVNDDDNDSPIKDINEMDDVKTEYATIMSGDNKNEHGEYRNRYLSSNSGSGNDEDELLSDDSCKEVKSKSSEEKITIPAEFKICLPLKFPNLAKTKTVEVDCVDSSPSEENSPDEGNVSPHPVEIVSEDEK